MSRRCSHCGHNGHNSRTCLDMKGGGFKLFGVRVSADSEASVATECSSSSSAAMRKSFSMCNLSNYGASEGGSPPPSASPQEQHDAGDVGDAVDGYASDDVVHTNSSSRERKKGVPWTEEEHRMFLIGLQKLGKGDWRGISRNFVKTRTPTQVASHAQKYFLRRNNLNKRRRRSSLFDMTTDSVSSLVGEPLIEESGCEDADICPELSLGQSIPYGNSIEASLFSRHMYPIQGYSVPAPRIPMTVSETAEELGEATESNDLEPIAMEEVVEEVTPNVDMMESVPEVNDATQTGVAQFPIPFPLVPIWPMQSFYATSNGLWGAESKLVKPTPIIAKPPEKIDDADDSCEMATNMQRPVMEPTPLSYKLLEEHSRQSAFHSTAQATDSREIDGQVSNAISVP